MDNRSTERVTRRRNSLHLLMPVNILCVVLALVTATGVASRASSQQEVDPAALPEGDGKALLYRLCSGCHDIPQVVAKRRTVKQWRELTIDMIARGGEDVRLARRAQDAPRDRRQDARGAQREDRVQGSLKPTGRKS